MESAPGMLPVAWISADMIGRQKLPATMGNRARSYCEYCNIRGVYGREIIHCDGLMAGYAQWSVEIFNGVVSRATKSRAQANGSIAIRGLLCEQENHLSYVLKLPDLRIREGEGQAPSRILTEQIERLRQPDTVNIAVVPPDSLASDSEGGRDLSSPFTFTDVYPSDKEPPKLRRGPRNCLKRFLLVKPRFAVGPRTQLLHEVLRTVPGRKSCITSEGPVMNDNGNAAEGEQLP